MSFPGDGNNGRCSKINWITETREKKNKHRSLCFRRRPPSVVGQIACPDELTDRLRTRAATVFNFRNVCYPPPPGRTLLDFQESS